MKTMLRRGWTLGVLVAVTACATGSPIMPGRHPDVITGLELARHADLDGLQVIRQLRPIWLNDRGADLNVLEMMDPRRGASDIGNQRGIKVYVDGIARHDGLDELRLFPAEQILEMRKLDSSDASMRFGINHSSGAILVTTKG